MVCNDLAIANSSLRSSAHYGAIAAPCDDDRLAAQLRIVPLFHGRIERVHVDVHDFAYRHDGLF